MKKWLAVTLLLVGMAPAARAGVELKPDGFYVNGNYFYPVGVNYMPRDSAQRYLVVLYHNARPATTTVTGRAPLRVSRCFRGTEPVATGIGLKFTLPAFGVQVCAGGH